MATPPARTFHVKQTPVYVFEDKRAMGAAAATAAGEIIRHAIDQRDQARVIVGTGNSQDEVIEELTRQDIDWSRVEVFHMDEYVGMADTHPASFRRWLRDHLVNIVHPAATHYMEGDAEDLDAECRRYGELLASAPVDICFAGFGENGHIAFNDPHVADFNDPLAVKRVAMDERCRLQQVGEGHFPTLETSPSEAITLTCPTLLNVEHFICCVPDQRKAEAVHNALGGPLTTDCPASAAVTHPRASIYLDSNSASLLSSNTER